MPKKTGSRIPRRTLEEVRVLALSAYDRGMTVDEVCFAFEVGRSTFFGWLKLRKENGPEALQVKMPPGPQQKLDEKQMGQLWRWIAGNDPRQLQFDFALWTREMVRQLITREFGVEYTPQAVGKLMHRIGLSPQRPLTRAWQQNSEAVRRWKAEEYPEIRKEAQVEGASIYFADEASVRTDYHTGTTWAPVGQTPIVRGTGDRKSINMMSAINAQGKVHFWLLENQNVNSAVFIEYCKKLMNDVPGKIYLIVDGHPSHKSKDTKKFVESTDGRLKLFLLPPYSPELNPDEWVWKNVKHDHVGRKAARTLDEMRAGIKKAFIRLVEGPDLVRAFFRSPDLAYIGVR